LSDAAKQLSIVVKNYYLKTSSTLYKAINHPLAYKPEAVGKTYEFQFETFPEGKTPFTVDTDVIIIGSGCGGGVAAKNLSEAGHKVLVVEKAYHFKAESLPMSDLAASVHLYENGQVLPSDSGGIGGIYAGATWGGGGAVNWSACLQTQAFVRDEWAAQGLKFFQTPEFQESLDRVCNNMGAGTDQIEHNHGNRVLLEGARRLGYAVKPVPQNTGGKTHYCGHCGNGCRLAEKLGPHNLWLPQAAKAGARFVEGFTVKEILFENINGQKKATGVRAVWTKRDESYTELYSREILVKAKTVVLSAGSLWSPILLQKSGLTNYNIGRNLHLHPTTMVFGIFKEQVNPCEGGILTSVVTEFDRLDGPYGVKLEATSMLPSNSMTVLPWADPLLWKSLILKHNHMNGYIALVRDRDGGRVYPDPKTGKPKVIYDVSEFDARHGLEGVIGIAKILYDQGALEIHTATGGVKPYIRNEASKVLSDEEFRNWMGDVRRHGLRRPMATFASAHQMGTCRMGTHPGTSVIDPQGRPWGTQDLYICDASAFPGASGVNPMITNMAISDWTSRNLASELSLRK
jgi:hypothetical protein